MRQDFMLPYPELFGEYLPFWVRRWLGLDLLDWLLG